MMKFRILLYICVIVSCGLIAIVFGTMQETAADQVRAKFGVKSDENVVLLDNDRYIQLFLALSDEEIDRITAHNKRDKLLVICSKDGYDRSGIKSNRIRLQSHTLAKEVEGLPELFAVISEKSALNEKLRKATPMISGEEKNLLVKIKQNESDRLRLVQVLTFAFAKHQDMCYTAHHETK